MRLQRIKPVLLISSLCAALCCALLFFALDSPSSRAQMGSGNYEIPVDAIDVGGGLSNSASYKVLDSVGETGSGNSNSATYRLNAGFLAAQTVYLAVSAPVDVSMSPSISGISGGTGTGSIAWTVTTDNAAGYSMSIRADTTPALRSATSSFADYTRAGANPDYTWGINALDSEFGFSPEGTDIIQRFKDNNSTCNTGVLDTADSCWDTLSTSATPISQRTSGNHPAGTVTTVKIRAEVGNSHIQPSGAYTSTLEVTVLPL